MRKFVQNFQIMNSIKILICGSRDWSDRAVIIDRFASFPPKIMIIHGGCRGADTIAGEVALSLGMEVKCFPANWGEYGRGAGPRRNQAMIDEGKPNLVIAFHDDLASSRGTRDMVARAMKSGIPVEVVTGRSDEE